RKGRARGDRTDRERPSSRAAVSLSEGGPAGEDPPRADGRCRRHSRAHQAEQGVSRALRRASSAERGSGGRLHAGGPGIGPERPRRRAMSDMIETRYPRERFGQAALYPAGFDRLFSNARRGRERQLSRVVAVGGGSGLPVVLRGLRRHLSPECRITAVVTAADDGGSSGVLRERYGVLPPGDIRNCLIALARVAPEGLAALQYRFDEASSPAHPVGNLLLPAPDMVAPDEVQAIRPAGRLLGVRGVVLPATTSRVHLVANLGDGRQVRGESQIPRSGVAITRLRIDPPDARPVPEVLEALERADAVILGPGSLYTSILAALVVPGMVEAVATAPGVRILVCNLMTEPGEPDGYGMAAHLDALAAHGLPPDTFDYVVVNTRPVPMKARARYSAEGAEPVRVDVAPSADPPVIVADDLLEPGPVVRHGADKLGALLCALAARHSPRNAGWWGGSP